VKKGKPPYSLHLEKRGQFRKRSNNRKSLNTRHWKRKRDFAHISTLHRCSDYPHCAPAGRSPQRSTSLPQLYTVLPSSFITKNATGHGPKRNRKDARWGIAHDPKPIRNRSRPFGSHRDTHPHAHPRANARRKKGSPHQRKGTLSPNLRDPQRRCSHIGQNERTLSRLTTGDLSKIHRRSRKANRRNPALGRHRGLRIRRRSNIRKSKPFPKDSRTSKKQNRTHQHSPSHTDKHKTLHAHSRSSMTTSGSTVASAFACPTAS